MSVYDIYVKSGSTNETHLVKSSAKNPDDAIYRLVVAGDYIPEAGDVIRRCVEVERKTTR